MTDNLVYRVIFRYCATYRTKFCGNNRDDQQLIP